MCLELTEKIRPEVRIRGKVLHYPCDLEIHFFAPDNVECFSDGIDVPEKLVSRFFVDHHRKWSFESSFGITGDERQVKHVEDKLIRPNPFVEQKFLIFDLNHNVVVLAEASGRFDFGKFVLQCRSEEGMGVGLFWGSHSIVSRKLKNGFVDPVCICVLLVKAELVSYKQKYEYETGKPYRQSRYIEEGISFVSFNVS